MHMLMNVWLSSLATLKMQNWDAGRKEIIVNTDERDWLPFFPDLGRMYNLVSRIQDGLGELKKLLETHIHNQGLAAIEKCGEAALNASIFSDIVLYLTANSSFCERWMLLIVLCVYIPSE